MDDNQPKYEKCVGYVLRCTELPTGSTVAPDTIQVVGWDPLKALAAKDAEIERLKAELAASEQFGINRSKAADFQIAGLFARIRELESVRVVLDTPNEVCDGYVCLTIAEAVAQYGPESLGWTFDPETHIKATRELDTAEKRISSLEADCALLGQYVKALQEHACDALSPKDSPQETQIRHVEECNRLDRAILASPTASAWVKGTQ